MACESLQIGEWVVDPAIDTIARGSEVSKLEPRMMRLLMCLAESPGAVVSVDRLLTEVWSGVIVGPASVYQSVSQLRKLLGDTGPDATYIATVARKGYRLVAPVKPAEDIRLGVPVVAPPSPPDGAAVSAAKTKRRLKLYAAVAAAGAILVGIAWAPVYSLLTAAPSPPSIAVLPFVDMTAAKADQPFCDGLTEELSSWLAQLPTLRVVSRTSAFAFRDKSVDVKTIGKQLGATHVLEGSMRRSGNNMRVTVQLIDTRDGYHLWSGSYDAAVTDVVKVQEDIARSIAANLEIRLTQVTTQRFAARSSNNAQAYQLYLLARHYHQLLTRDGNDRAIELSKQAIAADPDFALAYVALASAYLNQRYFQGRSIAEIAADAEPLLSKAVSISPALSDIYVVRGAVRTELRRPADALRDLQRAIQLDPNSREALGELGYYYLTAVHPREALQYYTSAASLDPLDYELHAQRCLALQDLAQFDAAKLACERARALSPEAAWSYSVSSELASAQGRIDEALRWNSRALSLSSNVAELYAKRSDLLLTLGMSTAARAVYNQAMAAARTDNDTGLALLQSGFRSALASGGLPALRMQISAIEPLAVAPRELLDVAYAQLVVGDAGAARRLVDRALQTPGFDEQMLSDPWRVRVGFSYQLIVAAAKLWGGERADAERRLQALTQVTDKLVADGVERYGVYELRAQILAVRGDLDGAMRSLTQAVDLGWRYTWWAEQEPYLAALHARRDYQALIKRATALNSQMRTAFESTNGQ
jgi:TolB-like protein/DNA-binding winged helix-turn-helix (wHTH) protein